MTISDWVLVGTSIFLGAIALFVPYLAEVLKRKLFEPNLKLTFSQFPPACHLTYWRSPVNPSLKEPVYFFRADLVNEGKSQARFCEAVLEELWIYDAAGNPKRVERFSPVKLRYDEQGTKFVDLNPKRPIFWNIGHISSPTHQTNDEKPRFIDIPGSYSDELRFFLELFEFPYGQPNCLVPGTYGLKIAIYSENSRAQHLLLKLSWSGKWQETEQDMFRELVIKEVSGFE
jgi:hypothetical protein